MTKMGMAIVSQQYQIAVNLMTMGSVSLSASSIVEVHRQSPEIGQAVIEMIKETTGTKCQDLLDLVAVLIED